MEHCMKLDDDLGERRKLDDLEVAFLLEDTHIYKEARTHSAASA